jgi:hypothetical protein
VRDPRAFCVKFLFSRHVRCRTGLSSFVTFSQPIAGDDPMAAHPISHPSDRTLSSYGLGKLDDASSKVVNQHLGSRVRTAGAGPPSYPPIASSAGSAMRRPTASLTHPLPPCRQPTACRCWPAGITARGLRRPPARLSYRRRRPFFVRPDGGSAISTGEGGSEPTASQGRRAA